MTSFASSYLQLLLDKDVSLNWPYYASGDEQAISNIIDIFAADEDDRKVYLPSTDRSSPGTNFIINNKSAYSAILAPSVGDEFTLNSGNIVYVYVDARYEWSIVPYGNGITAISNFNLSSSSDAITITGGDVSPPSGNIEVSLNDKINALSNTDKQGFLTIDDDGNYITRDLIAGSNISITNSNGQVDDPTISLVGDISGISTLNVGNLTISNSNIVTDSEYLTLNKVDISEELKISGALNYEPLPKAVCVFRDATVNELDIVVDKQFNISKVTGGKGVYKIEFSTAMQDVNYGVQITLGSESGELIKPTVKHAFYTDKTTEYVTIVVVDIAGEYVTNVPQGLTISII